MQIIFTHQQSNDFIQSILAKNDNKSPNIMCYSEEQMLDLKSCMQNGSIIGIDKTFNLGACIVMLHVFCIKVKNFWGRDRVSVQFFWAQFFFLHWDGSYAKYCTFLSKIRASSAFNIDCENIIFGTDEENCPYQCNKKQLFFKFRAYSLCSAFTGECSKKAFKTKCSWKKQGTALFKNIFFKNRPSKCRGQGFFYLEKEQEILVEFTSSNGSYLSKNYYQLLNLVQNINRYPSYGKKNWKF